MTHTKSLPVAVTGAGRVGMAAAAEIVSRGMTPPVFERGPAGGAGREIVGRYRAPLVSLPELAPNVKLGATAAAIAKQGAAASSCGGGPAASEASCCVADEVAKSDGEAGCGGGTASTKPARHAEPA